MQVNEYLNQIANAKVFKSGNLLKDGRYRFVVERIALNKGHKGVCFIPELRVKSAEKIEPDTEPNAVGTTVSCPWNLTTNDNAAGNVKEFILALVDLDASTAEPDAVHKLTNEAISDAQPFRGLEIDCTTVRKVNQGKNNPANRGQVMTIPRWKHVSGQSEESMARNCAALEAAPEAKPQPASVAPEAKPTGFNLAGILKKK